jgi:hypothetical protein
MKQNNYYEIHKNKKPKRRLQRRKINSLSLMLLSSSMVSIAQHATIVSQHFNSVAEKSLAVFENITKQAQNIHKIISNHKKNKYLTIKKATN